MNKKRSEWLTVPNAISAAGFGLVANGVRDTGRLSNVAQIAAGRTLDLVDGKVARALDQESDTGARIDAGLDKLGMAAIFLQSWRQKSIPRPAIAAMLLHNGINGGAAIAHELVNPHSDVRPSKIGKIALFLENVGALSYLTANALEKNHSSPRTEAVLRASGHTLTTVGVGLGLVAGAQYIRDTVTASRQQDQVE